VNRTRPLDLLIGFLVFGVAAYALLRLSYDAIPALSALTPVPLAVLAVAELALARRVRRAVGHDPDAKPMVAIAIARLVALGKASAMVGAGVAGAATGLVVHVAPDVSRLDVARGDALIGAFLAVAGAALMAAGLVLERAGIAPISRDRR
jgi:hypothetical protein